MGPLVVIVGTTASGKSSLALDLARRFNGEIVCADSRTVYKGMDVGTAKPSSSERNSIKHYLIDVVEPSETYSAAIFKASAVDAIADITRKGKLPILVGGTGLYIDGVIFDFAFLPLPTPSERQELESMTIEQLQSLISKKGIRMPENSKNKRYLIRAIETNGEVPVKKGLRENTLVLGLDLPREELKTRLKKRVEKMVDSGFIEETRQLVSKYGWDAPGLKSTGYKAFKQFIDGDMSLEEAKAQFVLNDFNLAKRQRTWFKRNSSINWIQDSSDAERLVNNFLQK